MCFVAGCLIETPAGPRPVDKLVTGDVVLTADGGAERLVWVGRSRITWAEQMASPRKRPVRIGTDALGAGTPERAFMVSPHHRVLCRSSQTARLSGAEEALVPAMALTELPQVRLMPSLPGLDYVHLACASHVLLLVEGLAVESLLPGPPAIEAMSPAQRIALAEDLGWTNATWGQIAPARPILSLRKAERLVTRSIRSGQPLVTARDGQGRETSVQA